MRDGPVSLARSWWPRNAIFSTIPLDGIPHLLGCAVFLSSIQQHEHRNRLVGSGSNSEDAQVICIPLYARDWILNFALTILCSKRGFYSTGKYCHRSRTPWERRPQQLSVTILGIVSESGALNILPLLFHCRAKRFSRPLLPAYGYTIKLAITKILKNWM